MQELTTNSKPKWLRKLERESWQAELIISGLAIIGSLQLPGLLDLAERYALLNYDRDTLFICYIAFIYWKIFVSGVIVLFIFHFVFRALWIGLVGLNSVYPGGFHPNKRYAEHFQEKLRREYGDIDGFIRRLDRLGSGVFGVGFGFSGVFLNFGLLGVVAIIVHRLLIGQGVDPGMISLGMLCLLVPLFTVSVLTMTLHSQRFRHGRIAKKFLWPVTKIVSKITYPLAGRYIITANNLVTSYYIDRKGLLVYFIAGILIITGVGVAASLADPNISFFIDKVYHRMGDDETRLTAIYPGGEDYNGIYYKPSLFERPTTGNPVAFWVPLPEREYHIMMTDCSQPEIGDTTSTVARELRRSRTLSCAREYIEVILNGLEVTNPELSRQYLVNQAGEQFGVNIYLADPTLRRGRNLLEVSTQYPHPETGEPRRTLTPFYISRDN